jgi:hypothetical protein
VLTKNGDSVESAIRAIDHRCVDASDNLAGKSVTFGEKRKNEMFARLSIEPINIIRSGQGRAVPQ